MSNLIKIFSVLLPLTLLGACKTIPEEIVQPAEAPQPTSQYPLTIIGGVEPVYFLPINTPFSARIDTGAETSSIDVSEMRFFERDGEKWVAFELNHNGTQEHYRFEKKIIRKVNIRRVDESEQRVSVMMTVKIGSEVITAEFTLANRAKFVYQALIGRNILKGRFMVDPSSENTLH